MARLAGVQNSMYNGNRYGGLRRLEDKLQKELYDILRKEELMWFQRSRAKWLSDGDRNTRYYHVKTVNRRRQNNVIMLRDDSGSWVDNVDQLQSMVNNFYKQLFTLEHAGSDWVESVISYPGLDAAELQSLEADITFEEVQRAVFNMKPWKAPGPDGFPAGFLQKSWSIVGASVYDFVVNVWTNPSAIGLVNQTDICLIPKTARPEFVNQFRPISLCNTIYKVVSKIMVERLKDHIPKLVSPFQAGFVPGRNIHENIIVAQEMIHSMYHMKGKKAYFAIKVDLAKAYDKLNWEFIWRILKEIGIPQKMMNVIMHSVTSVETNVKWNGARADFFRPQRGIRQGDPISPYLFVLCIDKLSHLIMHAVETGEWKAIKAGRNGPVISHLMFADDLLLFGEATECQISCVCKILDPFCRMSGQQVSQDKTSIYFSKNASRVVRDRITHFSGFRETACLVSI
jgi:hypothetical protein